MRNLVFILVIIIVSVQMVYSQQTYTSPSPEIVPADTLKSDTVKPDKECKQKDIGDLFRKKGKKHYTGHKNAAATAAAGNLHAKHQNN